MEQIVYKGKVWKVGDIVKVERRIPDLAPDGMGAGRMWVNMWTAEMDRALGKTYRIHSIEADRGVRLIVNGYGLGFALEGLTNQSDPQPFVAPFQLKPLMRVGTRNGRQFIVVEHDAINESGSPEAPLYLCRNDTMYGYVIWPGQNLADADHEIVEVFAAPEYVGEVLDANKRGEKLWSETMDVEKAKKAALVARLQQQRAELDSRINELGAQ